MKAKASWVEALGGFQSFVVELTERSRRLFSLLTNCFSQIPIKNAKQTDLGPRLNFNGLFTVFATGLYFLA